MDLKEIGNENLRKKISDFLSKEKDKPISLRAFSRNVGVNNASISRFLNRRRGLTREQVQRILSYIKVPKKEAGNILTAVTFNKRDKGKVSVRKKLIKNGFKLRDADLKEYLKDPLNGMIKAALEAPKVDSSPESLAKMFKVSKTKINKKLVFLKKIGLLKELSGGKLQTVEGLFAPLDQKSPELLKRSRELLKLAIKECDWALENIDSDYKNRMKYRDTQSLILKCKKENIPEIRKRLYVFLDDISDYLQDPTDSNEIVMIMPLVIPCTHPENY